MCLRNLLYFDLYLQLWHVKTQSLPQIVYTKTTHTHTHFQGLIQKHVRNITYNKDKLNYTINILIIRAIWPHRGNYGVRGNLGHKAIAGYDVTGTKKNKMNRNTKISLPYRPMPCLLFIAGKYKREGKCVTKALLRRQTAEKPLPYWTTPPSTRFQTTHNLMVWARDRIRTLRFTV